MCRSSKPFNCSWNCSSCRELCLRPRSWASSARRASISSLPGGQRRKCSQVMIHLESHVKAFRWAGCEPSLTPSELLGQDRSEPVVGRGVGLQGGSVQGGMRLRARTRQVSVWLHQVPGPWPRRRLLQRRITPRDRPGRWPGRAALQRGHECLGRRYPAMAMPGCSASRRHHLVELGQAGGHAPPPRSWIHRRQVVGTRPIELCRNRPAAHVEVAEPDQGDTLGALIMLLGLSGPCRSRRAGQGGFL